MASSCSSNETRGIDDIEGVAPGRALRTTSGTRRGGGSDGRVLVMLGVAEGRTPRRSGGVGEDERISRRSADVADAGTLENERVRAGAEARGDAEGRADVDG
ncbi:MAG: hypothetical protein ABI175_15705, partial [Polyangiales bacterium]